MASAVPAGLGDRSIRVGLDIGGTKTDAVALSADGGIVGRIRRATGYGDEAVVSDVVESVRELRLEVGFDISDVASVGVGIPGLVDPERGLVLHAVNLGVESLALAARAGERLATPVFIENDVKAATLGAATLGAAALGAAAIRADAGLTSMAYLNLGTGVAAGIVVDGALWRGSRGTAGEVGHISVDPNGRVCSCGQRGCIETLCGGGALARAWGRPGALPVRDIFDAADLGDAEALLLRADLSHGAAAAVRVLVLSADVEMVVIGGGLTALGERLGDGIRTALIADAAGSPFLRSLHLDERIEMLPAGSPAAALGAALVGSRIPEKETAVHG